MTRLQYMQASGTRRIATAMSPMGPVPPFLELGASGAIDGEFRRLDDAAQSLAHGRRDNFARPVR